MNNLEQVEQPIQPVDHQYLTAAERLWQILDNIDTLSDMIKPTGLKGYAAFYKGVMTRVRERFNILVSDGYTLQLPKECDLKIKDTKQVNDLRKYNTQGESL